MEDVREKIGVIGSKASAAHARIDKLEILIRDDLKDLKSELKDLNAYMHRGKGWAAAMIFFGGLAGALLVKLFMKL